MVQTYSSGNTTHRIRLSRSLSPRRIKNDDVMESITVVAFPGSKETHLKVNTPLLRTRTPSPRRFTALSSGISEGVRLSSDTSFMPRASSDNEISYSEGQVDHCKILTVASPARLSAEQLFVSTDKLEMPLKRDVLQRPRSASPTYSTTGASSEHSDDKCAANQSTVSLAAGITGGVGATQSTAFSEDTVVYFCGLVKNNGMDRGHCEVSELIVGQGGELKSVLPSGLQVGVH